MDKRINAPVCDVANLILGAFLFFSPWIFDFASGAESWNAWVGGIVIGILSIAALLAFAEWSEWLNLVLGLWTLVSPWVLKISGSTDAMRTNVIVGLSVAVIAAIQLGISHRVLPRMNARSTSSGSQPNPQDDG